MASAVKTCGILPMNTASASLLNMVVSGLFTRTAPPSLSACLVSRLSPKFSWLQHFSLGFVYISCFLDGRGGLRLFG